MTTTTTTARFLFSLPDLGNTWGSWYGSSYNTYYSIAAVPNSRRRSTRRGTQSNEGITLKSYSASKGQKFPVTPADIDFSVDPPKITAGVTSQKKVYITATLSAVSFSIIGKLADGTQVLSGEAAPSANSIQITSDFPVQLSSGKMIQLISKFILSTANSQSWESQDYLKGFLVKTQISGKTLIDLPTSEGQSSAGTIAVTPTLVGQPTYSSTSSDGFRYVEFQKSTDPNSVKTIISAGYLVEKV